MKKKLLKTLVLLAGGTGLMVHRVLYPNVMVSGTGDTIVLCIGDSITYGQGVLGSRKTASYPALLSSLLGSDYQVKNYGLSSRTLQSTGNMPYTAESFYKESLAENADIVIIMLGTNDSKPAFWNAENYEKEYLEFVQTYQNMDSKPKVYLMIPPAIYLEESNDKKCCNETVRDEVAPIIRRVAEQTGTPVIDLYSITEGHADWYRDGLHPVKAGNEAIANEVYRVICE